MGLKVNKVKADLCSYPPFLFLAERKFGKTTWWYNLVPAAWGDDSKGYLISFGDEEGYHALDGLQVERAKKWSAPYDEETDERGFIQIVDDIIENNDEYGLKGVCFDTLDTMVEVATKEVLRQHKIEKGTVCKSLNDAFGGFSRGVERLLAIVNEQIDRLKNAGLAVFILCHTKQKEKTDLRSGVKYEQITNNLQANIYTNIADKAQMVMVGLMDRTIEEGRIVAEERSIYLRQTSEVDAGSRFHDLPEKISLDPKEFLAAFEQGVKGSIRDDATDVAEMKKDEEKALKERAEIAKKKEIEAAESRKLEEKREEYISLIVRKTPGASAKVKKQFKQLVSESGCSNIKDPNMPVEVLSEIASLLTT